MSNGIRLLAATVVAAAVAAGAVACGAPNDSEGGGKSGPIKVGLIFPTSGNVAAAGTDMLHGWQLYWKVNGGTVAGRKVQSTHEDDAGDPTTALTKARKLVEQNGATTLAGPLLASSGYALADYLKTNPKLVGLNPVASSDDLSQRRRVDNYIKTGGWQSSSPVHPAGEWAYQQGWRKVVTLCQDYAFGYESCGGFVNTFTDHGGKVVKQLYAPLGTSDYTSYLAQIPKDVDGVFVTTVGADSPRFLRAWKELGFKGKVPLITNETTIEQSTLRGMHGDEALGLQSFGHYAEERDSPGTRRFVDEFKKAYGQIPSYYSCATYTAAQWFAEAVKQLDGDISDPDKLRATLQRVQLKDTCFGPMRLDDHGGTVANSYLRKVERRGGALVNVPEKTYPQLSQFWRYKPADFLAQPVYTRKYQGADWPKSCTSYASDCGLEGSR
jgi:branched-chain amino acid transport system substrate-binding protein